MSFIKEQQEKAVKKLTRDCNLVYPPSCTEFCSLRQIVSDTIKNTAKEILREQEKAEYQEVGELRTVIFRKQILMENKCNELIEE